MTSPDEEPVEPRPAEVDAEPSTTGVPGAASEVATHEADGGDAVETAEAVIESAAGFVVAAAVAPFAAGETGPIMGSIHDAVEGGIQRLTHLGHHHDGAETAAPEAKPGTSPTPGAAGPAEPPEDDPPA
jgi:hypothetical protein